MKKFYAVGLLVLVFALSTFSQQPDRWRDLILDQSTPEDATRVLGAAKKDKVSRLGLYGGVSNWLSKKQKESVYRMLTFEFAKGEGVKKAYLYFLENKLVVLMLEIKSGEISPNGISNIYGLTFFPMIGTLDLAVFQKDYERDQGKIYPKTYPTVYSLVAVSEKSFVDATVGNVPSLLGALGRSAGIPDTPGSYPGKVMFVTLVSRTLENRDGGSILK